MYLHVGFMKCYIFALFNNLEGSSCPWSYGSYIYSFIYASSLKLGIPLRRGVLDTTLCDKVCQWLATGRLFSLDIPVSITNKTDHHGMAETLLKVALNTINQTKPNKNEHYWICFITFSTRRTHLYQLSHHHDMYVIQELRNKKK
jgi:hypothetical protein